MNLNLQVTSNLFGFLPFDQLLGPHILHLNVSVSNFADSSHLNALSWFLQHSIFCHRRGSFALDFNILIIHLDQTLAAGDTCLPLVLLSLLALLSLLNEAVEPGVF